MTTSLTTNRPPESSNRIASVWKQNQLAKRRLSEIGDRLYRSLPIAHAINKQPSRTKTLDRADMHTLDLFNQRIANVYTLFSAIADTNVEYVVPRGEWTDRNLKQSVIDKLRAVPANAQYQPLSYVEPFRLSCPTPLPTKSSDQIAKRFADHWRQQSRALVSSVYQSLRKGMGNSFGSISFSGDDQCKFSFYTRRAIQLPSDRQPDADGVLVDLFHCQHTHHLEDVELLPADQRLGGSNVLVPRKHLALIRAIPDWLRPDATVVTGTLRKEREVARYVGRHEERKKPRPPEVREDNLDAFDPAIVLFDVVLTGYGVRELAQVRRQVFKNTLSQATSSTAVEVSKGDQIANGILQLVLSLIFTPIVFILLVYVLFTFLSWF